MASEGPDEGQSQRDDTLVGQASMYFQREQQMQSQAIETPTTSRAARPAVDAQELQLAAQLEQGLASRLGLDVGSVNNLASLQVNRHDLPDLQNHNDPGLDFASHAEADLSLRNLAPELRHQNEGPVLPDKEREIEPENYEAQDSMPLHMTGQHVIYDVVADGHPSKKRVKVSRACDECRRKKIKCNLIPEMEDGPCSHCSRSMTRCLFSRPQQKRGPRHGAMKEVNERLARLEGKLVSSRTEFPKGIDVLDSISPQHQQALPSHLPLNIEPITRKRSFGEISTDSMARTPPAQKQTWHPRPLETSLDRPLYLEDKLVQPRKIVSTLEAPLRTAEAEATPSTETVALDGDIYAKYLRDTHPTLPFLPESKDVLETYLADCGIGLRSAFTEALTLSAQIDDNVQWSSLLTRLLAIVSDAELQRGHLIASTRLVCLQTLLLLLLTLDSAGSYHDTAGRDDQMQTMILGRAVALALALNLQRDAAELLSRSLDQNSILRIRVFCCLISLDHWHTIGTARPLALSQDAVRLVPELKEALGERAYRFFMLSRILGHWSLDPIQLPPYPPPRRGADVSILVNLYIEAWFAELPASLNIETGHDRSLVLPYWHCRIFTILHMPSSLKSDLLCATKEFATHLCEHSKGIIPLAHHFLTLLAACLLELSKLDETRVEARGLLTKLFEASFAPSPWSRHLQERIAKALNSVDDTADGRDSVEDSSMATDVDVALGLHSPVDRVPTGIEVKAINGTLHGIDAYGGLGFDPRPLLRAGYLQWAMEDRQ